MVDKSSEVAMEEAEEEKEVADARPEKDCLAGVSRWHTAFTSTPTWSRLPATGVSWAEDETRAIRASAARLETTDQLLKVTGWTLHFHIKTHFFY